MWITLRCTLCFRVLANKNNLIWRQLLNCEIHSLKGNSPPFDGSQPSIVSRAFVLDLPSVSLAPRFKWSINNYNCYFSNKLSTNLFSMFGRSLLVARRLPLIIQKATFARKVITPRIVRVLDKDAQPYPVDSSAIPRPSMIDHQYDDSFMFGDHVKGMLIEKMRKGLPINILSCLDASQQVMKISKVKSSEKARPDVPLYQKANDRKNEFKYA